MKRTLLSLLPILILCAGCALGVEDQETWSTEEAQGLDGTEVSAEPAQGLDGTEVSAEPALPTTPSLEAPELQGDTTELDESARPDPDPWMNGDDPVRPDPDPWAPSSHGPKSSSSSSGAADD